MARTARHHKRKHQPRKTFYYQPQHSIPAMIPIHHHDHDPMEPEPMEPVTPVKPPPPPPPPEEKKPSFMDRAKQVGEVASAAKGVYDFINSGDVQRGIDGARTLFRYGRNAARNAYQRRTRPPPVEVGQNWVPPFERYLTPEQRNVRAPQEPWSPTPGVIPVRTPWGRAFRDTNFEREMGLPPPPYPPIRNPPTLRPTTIGRAVNPIAEEGVAIAEGAEAAAAAGLGAAEGLGVGELLAGGAMLLGAPLGI